MLSQRRPAKLWLFLLYYPKWIENQALCKDLNSVVMVDRIRVIKGEEQIHKTFYISILVNPSAEKMAQYIRNHWTIENNLHCEDSPVAVGHYFWRR